MQYLHVRFQQADESHEGIRYLRGALVDSERVADLDLRSTPAHNTIKQHNAHIKQFTHNTQHTTHNSKKFKDVWKHPPPHHLNEPMN